MTILNLRKFVAVICLLCIPACVTKNSTIEERIDLLASGYETAFPSGDGPFPVVLFFHGCGGLFGYDGEKNVLPEYRTVALEEGYVVVTVDSFRPRGIDFDHALSRVCSGLKLRGRRRAGDLVASLVFADRLPFAADKGFVLAGWSHGGWTVMEAMTMDFDKTGAAGLENPKSDVFDQVSGVYLTYPYCGFPATTRRNGWARIIPTSVVVAENDTIAKARDCDQAFARMRESGVPIDIEVFEGVTHAFDENDHIEKSTLVYDPVAAAKAHERFRKFLRETKKSAMQE